MEKKTCIEIKSDMKKYTRIEGQKDNTLEK